MRDETDCRITLEFQNKVALVTGAAGVLGQAIARAFVASGARVAINDLRREDLDSIARSFGDRALAVPGDISEEAVVDKIVNQILTHWGGVDILVNNAGCNELARGTSRQPLEDWRHVIDVNLQGPFLLSKAVGKLMCKKRAGAIINVASVTGLCGFPGSNAYGVSKAGLVMMTQTMGTEFARHGVRVNGVAPSLVEMPTNSVLDPAVREAFVRRTPLGRPAVPEEVAAVIVFLASDLASFVAGATVPVDGGWSAFGGIGDAASRF